MMELHGFLSWDPSSSATRAYTVLVLVLSSDLRNHVLHLRSTLLFWLHFTITSSYNKRPWSSDSSCIWLKWYTRAQLELGNKKTNFAVIFSICLPYLWFDRTMRKKKHTDFRVSRFGQESSSFSYCEYLDKNNSLKTYFQYEDGRFFLVCSFLWQFWTPFFFLYVQFTFG